MIHRAFQSVIARKNAGGGAPSLLLDTYTAAHAYSLRKLRTAYSGSAIRVRRSSDNAEQDIGFSGEDLDTSSLEAFCGAGDGYVVAWYDQVGSSDMTQSTSTAQFKIVSSGSTITGTNSLPAADGSGVSAGGYTSTAGATQPNTLLFVAGLSSVTRSRLCDGSGSRQIVAVGEIGNTDWSYFAGSFSASGGTPDTNDHVIDVLFNGASSDMYVDNVIVSSGSAGAGNLTAFRLTGNNPDWEGRIQEAIVFDADLGGDRSAVRSAVNSYYGTY